MFYIIQLKNKRSLGAQQRSGILPLMAENGQYVNLEKEMRICPACCLDDVENGNHFIFYCPLYAKLHSFLLNNIKTAIS